MPNRRYIFFKSALVLLCIFLVFASSCKTNINEQEDRLNGKFSIEQLQADFRQMRAALENNHPDRLRYESAAMLTGLFDAAFASLQNDMTEREFYRIIAPLVARYHCGHTNIRPSSPFSNSLQTAGLVMPLGIYLADGKAYIDADYNSGSGIRLGCELLSINGEPLAGVLARMLAGISADALNTSAKIQKLNRNFSLYYYYFWGEVPQFDLSLKAPAGGAMSIVRVNAKPYSEVNSEINNRFPQVSRLNFAVSSKRAVLTVPSFVASQNPDYRTFFENSFRQMNDRGVAHLIIDIRDNGGGDPEMAVALIAHLIDKPFIYFKKGLGYANLFVATAPHAVHFDSSVYVLIDGGCFSTSGHFCSMLRYHKLATFVGETGGGTFRCHDNSSSFVLTNTGIQLRVARTTYETAVPDQDVSQGFSPDFRVAPTINDILAGNDPQIDFAASLWGRVSTINIDC